MSDATVLSQFSGDVQAHGVYMSLGNINKEVRADISNGAWLLVALIPKSKWTKTLAGYGKIPEKERTALLHLLNRRLFHRCLEKLTEPFQCTEPHEALDPEGNTRLVQYELSIYGADLEEQCHIAGTARNTCPQCIAQGSTLGNPECQCIRSSESILRDIKKIFRDYNTTFKRNPTMRQFLEQCKKYDLNGVHKPFWRRLPDFDICKVLSPDMLHGVHKMFFDHIYKWNVNGLGLRESDTRLIAQIPTAGERSFPQGASKLQQLSGKDHRALERVHLPIVAHAPSVAEGGGGSQKLTKATRGIMDCIFLAQYPIQNEQTLAAFEESYRTFHANKEVWIENKSKRSKKRKKTKKGTSNVIEGWAIQKIHILRHIPEHIRLKGTMDNYNTETMEHLHRPMLKDTYKSTNRREWIKQITNLLKRSETIRNYTEWMEWNHEETERVSKEETGEQGIPQDDFGEEEEEGKDGADGTRVGLDGECRREDDGWEGGQELLEPLGRQEQPGFGDGQMVMECNAGTVDNGTTDDVQMEPVCDFPTTPTPYYRVAINPTARRVVVNLLMGRFDLPRFVTHLHQHPYFAALPTVVDEGSRLNVWTLMRIKLPPSPFIKHENIFRIISQPGYNEKHPQHDAVFYVPTNKPGMRVPEQETLHDYSVGRVILLFSLAPCLLVPEPRLMAYVQRFSPIPKAPSRVSGLYAVAKLMQRGLPRYEVIAASQIARPCPLAPYIEGPAVAEGIGHASFDYYSKFYINKYRTPQNFTFLHHIDPPSASPPSTGPPSAAPPSVLP
ncbi:hypothetical protein BDV93DRAFT_482507 [Ceratobasidium sp. AG-I]|nr:hypothetical protein BDV93DRAFT_482507 [Ceratobasidium sp. AG-I]